ncbi:MAG: hypothetical protein M3O50_05570, partial [Myxococcota bacterium]|nr:hypothetical protein [Myxococcota bacterium]
MPSSAFTEMSNSALVIRLMRAGRSGAETGVTPEPPGMPEAAAEPEPEAEPPAPRVGSPMLPVQAAADNAKARKPA